MWASCEESALSRQNPDPTWVSSPSSGANLATATLLSPALAGDVTPAEGDRECLPHTDGFNGASGEDRAGPVGRGVVAAIGRVLAARPAASRSTARKLRRALRLAGTEGV